MMKIIYRLLNNITVLILVGGCCMFLLTPAGFTQEEMPPQTLSTEDINALRTKIFSNASNFKQRTKIASTLTRLLEIRNRSRHARRLCLDFYSSAAIQIKDSSPSKPTSLIQPYKEWAQAIDKGIRQETIAKIDAHLKKNPDAVPHPYLALLALKANSMNLAYYALFEDISDKQVDASSLYVLGIIAARESRFIEAERFMIRAQGGLGSLTLERWLLLDLAKISIVNKKIDDSHRFIQQLLSQNPKDAQALCIMIMSNMEKKKDLARQQLSQLIDILYPDPYLIAETAKLAIQLMEMDTASGILEKFLPQVEPNRDFYETLAFVRKNQGKEDQAEEWAAKARQVRDFRVAVSMQTPLDKELKEAVDLRNQRKAELDKLEGMDRISKAYYCLLDADHENAIAILQHPQATAYESFILADIQRRAGLIRDAAGVLRSLKSNHPDFRPYQVLALLADFNVRLGDSKQAISLYKELKQRFPQSYQAEVSTRVLSNPKLLDAPQWNQPIPISNRASRFTQHAAPFALTEIRKYWGDPISFASLANLMGVSPHNGISFAELIAVLNSLTRYQVTPFTGVKEAIFDCLQQKIPIVFCQGEMFSNQLITRLTLLTGADESREIFYAEGITPYEKHILTETEILGGICCALYPSTMEPQWSNETLSAIEKGKEYITLHMEASRIRTDPNYDALSFMERRNTIVKETGRESTALQLAFCRWITKNQPALIAIQYLKNIEVSCGNNAIFQFFLAEMYARLKKPEEAGNFLEKAINRQPETPRFELAKVRMLSQYGETGIAIKKAETLRNQFIDDPTVSFQLLLLYKESGNTKKMIEEEARLEKLIHRKINIDPDTNIETLQ